MIPRQRSLLILLLTAGSLTQIAALGADKGAVPYPDGYRRGTFLHSSLVPKDFGPFKEKPCVKPCTAGIFHFYANDKAMKGLRKGSYPDGAVITEELLEVIGDTGREGERRMVGVMVRNSRRYAATGGWGYATYDSGGRTNTLDAKAQDACYQCHLRRKDKGYVFTEYVER
jgi:hypothetical protein